MKKLINHTFNVLLTRSFMKGQIISDLEVIINIYSDELRKYKGWSLKNLYSIVTLLITAIEPSSEAWRKANRQERKEALCSVANKMIDVPILPEFLEQILFEMAFDLVYDRITS